MTPRYFFKHAVLGLMALTMVSAALSSCGGDDDHTNGGSPPSATASGPDSRGFLLAVGLFGAASGTTPPIPGVLSRDATDHYSLSLTLNGSVAQVPLANFVPSSGTDIGGELPPVTVIFPPRTVGLITFDESAQRSYLNLNFSVTWPSLWGAGTVDLINATVANFSLDITPGNPDTYPTVFLESRESYAILGIRGVYVQPTSYIGDGNGPAGFYTNLLNGTVIAQVLVFREAVYDVRL